MKPFLAVLAALALCGCEGVRFGLDLANAETTVGISYGDGKTMVRAEQGGQRVSGHFTR
jgi:hypothetical protein